MAYSKYDMRDLREILKATTLYSDGKTQVPAKVVMFLRLTKGKQIIWVKEGDRIYVESATSSKSV